MSDKKVWDQLQNAPPPVFFNDKEREFQHAIATEIQERVLPQQVIIYPISIEGSNFHSVYGETLHKVFLAPIHAYCLVDWEGYETNDETVYGIDRVSKINCHFTRRRINDEKNLEIKVGDILLYNKFYYEIVKLNSPREMFGNTNFKVEISAECIRAREDFFD